MNFDWIVKCHVVGLFSAQILHVNIAFGFLPSTSTLIVKNRGIPLSNKHHATTVSTITKAEFESEAAESVIDNILLPMNEHGKRSEIAREGQGVRTGEALSANDPRLALTYGEFPIQSFDELVERGMMFVIENEVEQQNNDTHDSADLEKFLRHQMVNQPYDEVGKKRRHLVDLGSGCGRLVFYSGLTSCKYGSAWNIHGIEISELLHNVAVEALQKGIENGFFYNIDNEPENVEEIFADGTSTKISLHLGPAHEFRNILSRASIVFAYSTVWPANDFSVEVGSLILGEEWSKLLANACPNGCVVITTDRALNPNDGFQVVDQLSVENPALAGSTGFVHILRK